MTLSKTELEKDLERETIERDKEIKTDQIVILYITYTPELGVGFWGREEWGYVGRSSICLEKRRGEK